MESAPQLLAVALVIESSILVARAWPTTFQYIMHMMKRLDETHTGYRLRIGVICYGTADTLPSPLLCNQFFIDYPIVIKELRDNFRRLGIGQTSSGGSKGMAALEGLVAGIELFDVLCNDFLGASNNINHIFHIAASSPDSSQFPTWNNSPILDHITWDALPSELKKREINLSSVYLQSQQRFIDLQHAASPGATSPWFPTHPSYLILLSGLSAPPPQKALPKRSGENTSLENTPESKRQRVSSSTADAAVPGAHASSPANPPSVISPPTQSQAPPPSLAQAAPAAAPPRMTYHQILENMRQSEAQLQNLENSIEDANQTGNTELAETLTQALKKKRESLFNFKSAIANYAQTQQQQQIAARQQAQAQAQQGQPQHQQVTSPNSVPSSSSPFNAGTGSVNLPHHHRSISGSQIQPPSAAVNPMPSQDSLNVPTRMPKAMDQNKLSPHPIGNNATGLGSSPKVNAMQSEVTSGFASGSGQPQPTHPQTGGPNPGAQPVWKGLLKWSGHSSQGKKDMHTFVTASSQAPQRCHANTWPQTLTLLPTTAVPMQTLQGWMKVHAPALCTFHPAIPPAQSLDPKTNEMNYRILVRVLTDRNFFATVSWITSSGMETKNALVFPVNSVGLLGAFFPVNGMPELPSVSAGNAGLLNLSMANFPPQVLQRLQSMTPEQRNSMMALMRQQQEQQLAHQNQAMGGNVAFGSATQVPASYGIGGPMSMHNGTSPFGAPAVSRPNAMLSGSQGDGPVTGNVSHEMLQAFMRRNVEG